MAIFSSILVPLDGSRIAAHGLRCAIWLSGHLQSRLHILSATSHPLPAQEELARLHVPEEYWPRVMLHQAPEYPVQAILAAITSYHVELVVMTALGRTAETMGEGISFPKIVGDVARQVIETCQVPVLLLPPAYLDTTPWKHVIVPVSGEAEADTALVLAIRLANALGFTLHVAHVTDSQSDAGIFGRAQYADSPHHEFPAQLKEFVSRAVPNCTPEECKCIEEVALGHGDVAAELLEMIERKHIDLLVIGWHARFMAGHAHVVKHLIQQVTCPVLLVHSQEPRPFRLKVAEDIV